MFLENRYRSTLCIAVGIAGSSLLFLPCTFAATINSVQHASQLHSIEKRLLACNPVKVDNLSQEEQDWYCKFQEGIVFFDGWKDITDDILAKVPEDEQVRIKVTMQALGIKVGCEWSRENDVRKISTEMLKAWGKRLRKAAAGDSTQAMIQAIHAIEYEVDELLSQPS
jgi:hypothetical protein